MNTDSRRSPSALKATGRILFGTDWHDGLQTILDVPAETLESWLAGRLPVPPGVWRTLDRCMGSVETMRYAQTQVRDALQRGGRTKRE